MDSIVSKLEFTSVRSAFRNEAGDFTTWMEEHIDALADRLGMSLTVQEREAGVGDFRADLLCVNESGKQVIVENQLEKTDHSHLGQILTYMAHFDAKTAIWVTANPRREHEKAIDFLNEVTLGDYAFYLVKVETVRIGDSAQAPLFSIISKPDVQAKEVGEKKSELSEKGKTLIEFWTDLLHLMNTKSQLFGKRSPGMGMWLSAGAGKSGINFNFWIRKGDCKVVLWIDHDHETGIKNKVIFNQLYSDKIAIEEELGISLNWSCSDEKRSCAVMGSAFEGDWTERALWPEIHGRMADLMVKYEQTFKYRLRKINV